MRLAILSMHGCPVARLGEKDTGGMNVYVLQTAKELGRRGHKVDVYTRWHDPNDPQVIDLGGGARVIHLTAGPYDETKDDLHQFIPDFQEKLEQFRLAENLEYDLIHSHYWLSGCVGVSLSGAWHVPHVAMFHTLARTKMQARFGEMEPPVREVAESAVTRDADTIVVSTAQEKEDLVRLYDVAPGKVGIVPAGVDLEMFRPLDKASAREQLGLTETRVVLSVGRIEPLKGLDILVGAMAMLDDTRDTKLLVVGGEPGHDREVRRLETLADRLGLLDVVRFDGIVSQATLPTYYSAADVFVMPSYYESFGLVALEAMACGIPVIASRVGGPRTLIRQGVNGYLVQWRCPEPFAQRLEVLLANAVLRENMGKAASARARTMGWDKVADELSKVYDSSLRARQESLIGA